MTVRAGQSRESSFVPHPFRVWAEGDKEDLYLAQSRIDQPVGGLRERLVRRPPKDEGELLADLPCGTRSAHLGAFGRLDELQREGGFLARRNIEGLPHFVDEVVARQPLVVCHQVMVSASAHTPRTGT